MNIVKKKLIISGMTCVNCQNKIEQKLSETAGIKSAKVSYNKGTADITYDTDEISLKNVIRIVEDMGYRAADRRQKSWAELDRIIWTLILIVSLYVLLQQFGILNLLVPGQLADSGMGYGMLFVVGLLTSVHCIVMCGGINLSCSIPRQQENAGGSKEGRISPETGKKAADGRFAAFVPAFAYNAGRVVSYTAIGFLLGAVGMLLGGGSAGGPSPFFQGMLKLIAGIFMVIMGINMLDLFPWLKKFGLRMPNFFAAAVGKRRGKGGAPFLIGLLNGLMPCGPLQSMQIVALASANPFSGALSMFFFSLGTVPLMLGFGSLVAALGQKFARTVTRVGAVLVTVLGLAMLSQGVSLSGVMTERELVYAVAALCVLAVTASIPFSKEGYRRISILAACAVIALFVRYRQQNAALDAQSAQLQAQEAETLDGVQVITSELAAGRYPNITVKAGIPVRWIIDAPDGSINGCNYRMLIRNYGIEHTFRTGENVIEFTPTEAGTVTYTCWMGMIRGNIFVTRADSAEGKKEEEQTASPIDAQALDAPRPSGYRIPTGELAVAKKTLSADESSVQQVEIALTEDGFSPAVVVVEKGVETEWTIRNERSAPGEREELLAVLYSTTLPLESGENSLYLYPSESFDVSTGDSAFYAYIKVVDDLESFDADAVRKEAEEHEPYVYPASAFEGVQAGGSCCY